MDILIAAAMALTGASTGSADLVRPAPLILRTPDTFKTIPEVWYLADNRPDTVVSAANFG